MCILIINTKKKEKLVVHSGILSLQNTFIEEKQTLAQAVLLH
jgi:hypothetical protein